MAVIVEDSCSPNSKGSATTETKFGSSSLSSIKVISKVSDVALVISPTVNIIVSNISTSVSNSVAVETVIVPDVEPIGIVMVNSETAYSSLEAVDNSLIVSGIIVS